MDCQIVMEVCKRAGERKAFPPFELERRFARIWLPHQPFGVGIAARHSERRPPGFEYQSSGGQSGGSEPKWPGVEAGTVQDGSILWTAQALSNSSLIYRISSVDYDVPSDVTLHEQNFIDEPGAQQVPMECSGGEAGETYDIIARVTTTTVGSSTQLYELVLRMTVDE